MNSKIIPSVNIHLNSDCNMKCRYCFASFCNVKHKCSTIDTLNLLNRLRELNFQKVNFVGGEPLLYKDLVILIKHSKNLGFNTSIVTNGSLLTKEFFEATIGDLDQIGLSIDSLCFETNQQIGRVVKGIAFSNSIYSEIISLINSYGVELKINTVVSSLNKTENLASFLSSYSISRWKIFQVLMVVGENSKDFSDFMITESDFNAFCSNQRNNLIEDRKNILISESENIIRGSYLMVNPEGKFFDNTKGFYTVSDKIIEVGVTKALKQICYDYNRFILRKGNYYINTNLKLAI